MRDLSQTNDFYRQELTVVRASCNECGDGGEKRKVDFGETENLVRMGCVTVEKFRKRWNIDDGCVSYNTVSFRVGGFHDFFPISSEIASTGGILKI